MNLVRLLKTYLLSNAQNSSKMLQGSKQPQINPLTSDIQVQIILQTYLHAFPQGTLIADHSTAALPHFFGKHHTIISPRDLKSAKKEKTYFIMSVNIRTFPYSISKNLIGYGIFRKHPSLSKKVQGIHFNSDL